MQACEPIECSRALMWPQLGAGYCNYDHLRIYPHRAATSIRVESGMISVEIIRNPLGTGTRTMYNLPPCNLLYCPALHNISSRRNRENAGICRPSACKCQRDMKQPSHTQRLHRNMAQALITNFSVATFQTWWKSGLGCDRVQSIPTLAKESAKSWPCAAKLRAREPLEACQPTAMTHV